MHHESNKAPEIPEIIDEAGDTPWWVPVLGMALFALFTLLFVVSQVGGDEPEAPGGRMAAGEQAQR